MTVSTIVTGLPPAIVALIQQNVLVRAFEENLFPRLLFRSEATPERWETNLGETKIWTRPGLLPRVTRPLTPGVDPVAETYGVEQWKATASQYGSSIPTHMPSSVVALAPLYTRNIQELGKQAGLSVNGLARDALFRAYGAGGNSVITAVAAAGAFTARVASIAGFSEKAFNSTPTPVSLLNPLTVTFPGTAEVANTVVAAIPDDPMFPYGPGTLQFGAALTTGLANRDAIRAANASLVIRSGGGNSVDALTSTDVLTLQDVINAVAQMRSNNVPPTADGYYHVHLTPEGEAQLYADQQFRQLFQSLPDSMEYRDLAIGQLIGCRFYRNSEVPNVMNVGATAVSSSSAVVAKEIGIEVANNTGLAVRRAIILGGSALYEPYLDESAFITAAGVNGKIGEFDVVNGGVTVLTDRIRLILRAPQDKLQQMLDSSWSWSGDFAVPSDELTGSASRFKRGVVIEHA